MLLSVLILVCIAEIHSYIEDTSHSKDVMNDFCHVNNFSNSSSDDFNAVHQVHINELEQFHLSKHFNMGSPFVVTGVTEDWTAVEKWDHSYFKGLFKSEELFSSTFSTPSKPEFCDSDECNRNTYYGIFINNPLLADSLSEDYEYPSFIPEEWWIKGNDWIHWGYPPCGAKRHMDLTCTSRVSVQISGSKQWRLYPVSDYKESVGFEWKEVLRPLSVQLNPGDALFWLPGWEHETKIVQGLSVSLSLHFMSPKDSLYIQTFKPLLTERVSSDCAW